MLSSQSAEISTETEELNTVISSSKVPVFLRKPSTEYWELDGTLTKILHWKSGKPSHHPQFILVLIPGNPGVIEYYEEYLQCLYAISQAQIEIYAIQHAGHGKDTNEKMFSGFVCNEKKCLVSGLVSEDEIFKRRAGLHVYSFKDQISHKKLFVDYLLEKEKQIVFIGHSVGAYISVELMKLVRKESILLCICLFPTLERISETPRAKQLQWLLNFYGVFAAKWACVGLKMVFSENYLKRIIRLVSGLSEVEAEVTLQLIDYVSAENAISMGIDEMKEIKELDLKYYKENIDKFIIYYGVNDGWTPREYYLTMKKRFPRGKIYECEKKLPHAFVLEECGLLMAEITFDFIADYLE